ncbi:MAG: NAD(P)/FAD-dependent oxidoreductase [Chloroflexi bacterium]|nr:NAD(P)/FAD-dependent oxidoreductase [Chloroflexota bacterium]
MLRVAIVGAGATGLSAAYDLVQKGIEVHLYEAGTEVGGLAAGFRDEGWDWSLEKFYHHWFANDESVLNLVKELGAGDKLIFRKPYSSFRHGSKNYSAYRPNTVVAGLRLPLSWPSKIRFGLAGLYLKFFKNWMPMERVTAEAWLLRYMGNEAYETLWKPALIAKFGPYYNQVNMAWLWARIYKRTPSLGTFEGGFQAFLELLANWIKNQGAEIHLNSPVQRIERSAEGRMVVSVGDQQETFDAVLFTSSPQMLVRLAPDLPAEYGTKLGALKSSGAVVVILALKQQLLTDDTYWLALPASDPNNKSNGEFPFLALIEHTNYMDRSHYGGDHLVYCGDYVPADHEYFSLSDDELAARFMGALPKLNPGFSPDWVRKRWVFRTKYAQPIPFVNHSKLLPEERTPVQGLYLASMSQVYPWDRGTNYSVEMGRRVAGLIVQDLGQRS